MADKKDYGFKGAGTLHVAIKGADGSYRGYMPVGNAEMFDLSPESDEQTRVSYQEETVGQALDTLITAKPTKIKYKFDTMTASNIAMALSAALLRGDNKIAGTVTAEAHTAYKGESIRLKHEYTTGLVLTTAAAGALVAGVDYAVDPLNSHFVEILSTGSIVDGSGVLAAYSYKAVTQDSLLGGVTSFDAKIEMSGINRVTGKRLFSCRWFVRPTTATTVLCSGDFASYALLLFTCNALTRSRETDNRLTICYRQHP